MLPVTAFLTATAYAPGLPSAANVGRWLVVGVGAAVMIWWVRLRPSPGHWMGFLLLAWMAMGIQWSISPADTLGELLQWCVLGAIFCIAAEVEDLTPAIRAFCWGITATVPLVIAQALGYQPVWNHMVVSPVGLFMTKNMLVEVAALAAVAALTYRLRWCLPGPAFCVGAAGGREGVLMIGAGLATWGFFALPRPGRIGAAALVVAAAVMTYPQLDFTHAGPRWTYMMDRFEIWQYTLDMITPLGWGLGSFGALTTYEFAHSELLQYAYELGAGVLLLIGVFAHALSNNGPARPPLAALTAACLVWFPLHAPGPAMVGALLAGHLCGSRGRARVAQPSLGGHVQPGGEPGPGPVRPGEDALAELGSVYLSTRPQPAAVPAHVRADVRGEAA